MTTLTRISAALLASALFASMAAEPAFAQTSRVGPAGGTSSTTAPSNSEGTPSGGTGVISTTRVGPSTLAPTASTPDTVAPRRPRRVRHHRRPAPRPMHHDGSSAGTSGSTAPSR